MAAIPITHLSYTMVDANSVKSSFGIKIPTGTLTMAEMLEFASEFGDLLDNVTECQITGCQIYVGATAGASLKGAAVANSDVNEGMLFTFSLDDSPYVETYYVPGFTQSKMSGLAADLTDADVIAFKNAIDAGLDASGTTVEPCNKFGVDCSTLLSSEKKFRK